MEKKKKRKENPEPGRQVLKIFANRYHLEVLCNKNMSLSKFEKSLKNIWN